LKNQVYGLFCDLEGSSHGLTEVQAQRDGGKPCEVNRIAGILAKIWTGLLPNIGQNHYCSGHPSV
jgi:hypothetical protein